jgi:hypothetical protein
MPLTNSGAVGLAAAFVAFVTTPYLGVGDSSTAFAATQTDLQAATNKLRKAGRRLSAPPARSRSARRSIRRKVTMPGRNGAWSMPSPLETCTDARPNRSAPRPARKRGS